MKRKSSMTKLEAWFLLIGGLIMGSIFIFLMQYAHGPITREEAIQTTAVFSSCAELRKRGYTKEITIRFEDRGQLYIDGSCVTEALRSDLRWLEAGAEVELLIHPNSSTILELRAGDAVLLDFQTASEKLKNENTGFTGLGLLCYVLSVCGLCNLVFRRKRS